MSILRLFGLVCSFIAFGLIFFRLRHFSERRHDVAILSLFGTAMLAVSLFPDLINLPAEILSLNQNERGRLLTLLIGSSILLWFLLIYERGKSQYISRGFDKLVRALAKDKFYNELPSIQPGSVLIIIPAYNEEINLRHIIPTLPKQIQGHPVVPLVVDDGGQDATPELCAKFNIPLARNLINRGGGAALRVGFDIALDLKACAIITMDGDGQHRVQDIDDMVNPIFLDQADLVIGSRLLGEMERYSLLRYYGVVLFGKIVSLLTGQRITDPASGFRVFNPKVLECCIFTQDQYHTAELIIEAAKRNLRIIERPITIKKRISGKSKKGKSLKYALYFLRTIIRTWTR